MKIMKKNGKEIGWYHISTISFQNFSTIINIGKAI